MDNIAQLKTLCNVARDTPDKKYVTITTLTGVYMVCVFHRNSKEKASQVEWLFESNLRSFGCFKCSRALWVPLNPSCKGNLLTRMAGHFRSRLSPDAQNRAFTKNWSCTEILNVAPIFVWSIELLIWFKIKISDNCFNLIGG